MKTKARCIALLILALAAFTACSGKKTHADAKTDALIEAANYIAEAKRGAAAASRLRALFGFEECPSKEIAITDRGTFESQYIKDTDYSVCWGFSVEGLKGIDKFLYYPPEDNKVHTFMGKFEINGQEFTYSGRGFYWDFLPGLTVRGAGERLSVMAIPYSDGGKRVTDGISFVWDSGHQAFTLSKQDRSQW